MTLYLAAVSLMIFIRLLPSVPQRTWAFSCRTIRSQIFLSDPLGHMIGFDHFDQFLFPVHQDPAPLVDVVGGPEHGDPVNLPDQGRRPEKEATRAILIVSPVGMMAGLLGSKSDMSPIFLTSKAALGWQRPSIGGPPSTWSKRQNSRSGFHQRLLHDRFHSFASFPRGSSHKGFL